MAVDVLEHDQLDHHEVAPPASPHGLRRFTRGGWLRALWTTPLAFGLATAIVIGIRWAR